MRRDGVVDEVTGKWFESFDCGFGGEIGALVLVLDAETGAGRGVRERGDGDRRERVGGG